MTKKKVFIAGAGGMLGEAFYKVFREDYDIKLTDKLVSNDWLDFLDFRDFDDYQKQVEGFKPDYLFHIGAYTDLEYCELNVADTYLTNTASVEKAVSIANELKIPLLYISTAGIFDGKKKIYDDWDLPNPMGHYAQSKYKGECYVIENANKYLICRAGWMMGGGPHKDKKFINKLIAQLVAGNRELYIVNDKVGNPTFTVDFAKTVRMLIEQERWGLYNLVCTGRATRKEIAQELIGIIGMKDKVTFHDVPSEHFSESYFAPRPPCERLVNKKLESLKLNTMRNWRLALKDYIAEYYHDYLNDKDILGEGKYSDLSTHTNL